MYIMRRMMINTRAPVIAPQMASLQEHALSEEEKHDSLKPNIKS